MVELGKRDSSSRNNPLLADPLNAKLAVMCRLLQNSRVLIIVFFALVLVACGEERIDPNAVPPVGTRPADLEYQLQQIDHLFVLQHYEQQRMEGPYQALGWLNDEFNAISVTEMDYRSVHQVPGMEDNTFYRFTLIIESFWTPAQAEQRLARLFERPPDLHVEQGKAFPLRRGFAIGRNVYTLATDVNAFSPELERLTKELEPQFREKVRFDP